MLKMKRVGSTTVKGSVLVWDFTHAQRQSYVPTSRKTPGRTLAMFRICMDCLRGILVDIKLSDCLQIKRGMPAGSTGLL